MDDNETGLCQHTFDLYRATHGRNLSIPRIACEKPAGHDGIHESKVYGAKWGTPWNHPTSEGGR